MAVTESAKHDLYRYLQETMGDERATTLMEMVSPTGWADVATKQDLKHEANLLRTEMTAGFANVRTEMAAEFTSVRTEMAAEFANVRTEMAAEFANVRTEMAAEFTNVRTEMAAEFTNVRTEMAAEFENVRTELAQFATKSDLDRALRTHTYFTVMAGGVLMGIAVTLARLA